VLSGKSKVIRYDDLGRHVARLEEAKNMYRPFVDKGSLKTSISKIKKKTEDRY